MKFIKLKPIKNWPTKKPFISKAVLFFENQLLPYVCSLYHSKP